MENHKKIVCKKWKSKKMIPQEFFDNSNQLNNVINYLEYSSVNKPLFIDRNIMIHSGNFYEGVFLENHFKEIEHLFEDLEEKADGDSL